MFLCYATKLINPTLFPHGKNMEIVLGKMPLHAMLEGVLLLFCSNGLTVFLQITTNSLVKIDLLIFL